MLTVVPCLTQSPCCTTPDRTALAAPRRSVRSTSNHFTCRRASLFPSFPSFTYLFSSLIYSSLPISCLSPFSSLVSSILSFLSRAKGNPPLPLPTIQLRPCYPALPLFCPRPTLFSLKKSLSPQPSCDNPPFAPAIHLSTSLPLSSSPLSCPFSSL